MQNSPKAHVASGCVTLFGLPFLLAGLVLSYLYFSGYYQWWRAIRWTELPCWVETVSLLENRGEGTTYQALATYRYVFKDKIYHSEQVSFSSGSDNIGDFQQSAYRELRNYAEFEIDKKGNREALHLRGVEPRPFRCYVNPENPAEAVLYRQFRWSMQAFQAIFALTFPAVGGGLVFASRWAARQISIEKRLRQTYPNEPWRWRIDWEQRLVRSTVNPWVGGVHAYTIWSGLVIAPLLFTTIVSGAVWEDRWSLMLLVFVIVWGISAYFSYMELRKRWMIGAACLHLDESFVSPGGSMSGEVRLGNPVVSQNLPEFRLECDKVITQRTADEVSVSSETVWTECNQAEQPHIRPHYATTYKVLFRLPQDAEESREQGEISYRWRVDMNLEPFGRLTSFDVPVFHTEQSRECAELERNASLSKQQLEADEQLEILVRGSSPQFVFDADQRIQSIESLAFQHKVLIAVLAVFEAVWIAISLVLVTQAAPMLFIIVWPLSSTIIGLVLLRLMFFTQRVEFQSTGIDIRKKLLLFHWSKHLPWTDIEHFGSERSMQSGTQNYFRVYAQLLQGRKVTLASGFRSERVANAVSRRIERWRN